MEKEQIIAKGVKHSFNGQTTIFEVESLNEHFDGLQYHESDFIPVDEEDGSADYIKHTDVNFDNATPKEVKPVEEIEVTVEEDIPTEKLGITFDVAELTILNVGGLAKLPEWEGFWFKNLKTGELLVFTKDNEILDTPNDEYKLREDWISVEATPEQKETLVSYFESLNPYLQPVEDKNAEPELENKEEKIETSVEDSEKEDKKEVVQETVTETIEEQKKEEVPAEEKPKKSSAKKK